MCRTRRLNADCEGADEFRLGFVVLVLEYEGDDVDEVVVKLVYRNRVSVGSGQRRNVADVLSGVLFGTSVARRSAP